MKVTGFSFVKNAIKYDYPIVEAIQSILPICDEFIVAVGKSDDKTLQLIREINPQKIKIIETEWDETQRQGGKVLALETDKAFAEISKDTDWAFYIQGDELVHEKYLPTIQDGMKKYKEDKNVDGLLFNYLHFYGSYDYVGTSSKWYTHEIRIIRNNKSFYSYKDAISFRKGENEKLRVQALDAYIYHYGWAKEPKAMQRKQENFHRYWHDDKWIESNVKVAEEFDYLEHVNEIKRFEGTHPKVMHQRIQEKNWQFDYDISRNKKTIKEHVKSLLKNKLNVDFGYKNYILLKDK